MPRARRRARRSPPRCHRTVRSSSSRRATSAMDRGSLPGRTARTVNCSLGLLIGMEDQMKGYFALALLPWLIGTALADVQPPPTQVAQKQPRTLGQKAVLHVYYYSPKTLEITYV